MKDFNKFYVNPVVGCGDNDKILTMSIDDDFDLTLKSESNVYVVFNAQAKILYRGDMCHCYIYSKIYRNYNGFWPEISSIEYYNDMMKTITENQKDPKSFWDYLATINKDTDEWGDPNIPYTEREKVSEEIIPYVESLEKQSEQKPIDKIEPRFKVGDWITNGRYIEHIIGINQDWPYYMFEDGTTKRIKDIDKKYRLWTIEDAKDGDVLITNKKQPFIFNGHYDEDTEHIYAYCGISDFVKDDSFLPCNEEYKVWCTNENVCPATKEQRDLLFNKMKEVGYKWDAEKKELKKTYVIDEGKDEIDYCFTKMMKGEKVTPAWSEEDETKLTTAKAFIKNTSLIRNDGIKEVIIDWLKSIKDRMQSQNHWKPTDDQIKAIRLARSFVTDDFDDNPTLSEILIELEEQLKKLKQE